MGWFEDSNIETLDLTSEQSKRLLEKTKTIENVRRPNFNPNNDVIDLSSLSSNQVFNKTNQNQTSQTSSSVSENNPFLGFFGNEFSSSGSSNNSPISNILNQSSSSNFGSTSSLSSVDHLKVKIEDLEYKIDRFLERLEKIENLIGK